MFRLIPQASETQMNGKLKCIHFIIDNEIK